MATGKKVSFIVYYVANNIPYLACKLRAHSADYYRIFDRNFQRPLLVKLYASEFEEIQNLAQWNDFLNISNSLRTEHGITTYADNNLEKAAYEQWFEQVKLALCEQPYRPLAFVNASQDSAAHILDNWKERTEIDLDVAPEELKRVGSIWMYRLRKPKPLKGLAAEWLTIKQLHQQPLEPWFKTQINRFEKWWRQKDGHRLAWENYDKYDGDASKYVDENPFTLLNE